MAYTENGVTEYTMTDLATEARFDLKHLLCSEGHRGLALADLRLGIGRTHPYLTYKGVCGRHGYTVYRSMAI